MPSESEVVRYGFLLLPEFPMYALILAIEALRIANQNRGRKLYSLASLLGRRQAGQGRQRHDRAGRGGDRRRVRVFPTVIVCAGNQPAQYVTKRAAQLAAPARPPWRRARRLRHRHFALAAAGLLEGYRSTLHWEAMTMFREQYPEIAVSRAALCRRPQPHHLRRRHGGARHDAASDRAAGTATRSRRWSPMASSHGASGATPSRSARWRSAASATWRRRCTRIVRRWRRISRRRYSRARSPAAARMSVRAARAAVPQPLQRIADAPLSQDPPAGGAQLTCSMARWRSRRSPPPAASRRRRCSRAPSGCSSACRRASSASNSQRRAASLPARAGARARPLGGFPTPRLPYHMQPGAENPVLLNEQETDGEPSCRPCARRFRSSLSARSWRVAAVTAASTTQIGGSSVTNGQPINNNNNNNTTGSRYYPHANCWDCGRS